MCNHCNADDNVTSDLSKFGFRELKMAAELLTAYTADEPAWLWEGVTVMMNRNSGNVFLTDEDYNAGMMNGDALEQWHNCPERGHEGFAEDVFETVPTTFDGEPDGADVKCFNCGEVHHRLTQAEIE